MLKFELERPRLVITNLIVPVLISQYTGYSAKPRLILYINILSSPPLAIHAFSSELFHNNN